MNASSNSLSELNNKHEDEQGMVPSEAEILLLAQSVAAAERSNASTYAVASTSAADRAMNAADVVAQMQQRRDSMLNNTKIVNNLKLNLNIINNNTSISSNSTGSGVKKSTQRYKMLLEGDVQVCKLPYSRNVIGKILNSKLLRRWKNHRLVLTDTEIYSTTVSFIYFLNHVKQLVEFFFLLQLIKKTDYMDSNIPYHTIIEVSPISKWEPGQKYYLRIATIECHYLLQVRK